ncbi:seryl-tRNA synthetase [Phycomyces nitens]|nr:seryl-tRNA synthetase [Phycomyces nitens]
MNEFQANYEKRRKLYSELLLLKTKHNDMSKAIKSSVNCSGDEQQHLISQSKELKAQVKLQELKLQEVESILLSQGLQIPNDTHPEAPVGPESEARLIKTVGIPRKDTTDNTLEDHLSIARRLNILDIDQAALVSGSSFYYLQGMGAFLETALIQYAMHKAAEHGFLGVITPDIVRTSIAYGCGFQPRSGESSQIYNVSTSGLDENTTQLCLAGTAEIPLAGKFATKILEESDLPQRLVGYGRAFRVEAGGRGTETKGLYRVHQFSKVELFAVTTSEKSDAMLEEFKRLQEDIFTELGLCFRILDMPTEELGASAYRKYDMEAWMPGRKKWGEVNILLNLL